jgi:hypothetical protein
MIREKVEGGRQVIIDLTGPDGNAFVLLGYAASYCKQLGWDAGPILEEMKSSDYENLITVFDRHFGDFVILER